MVDSLDRFVKLVARLGRLLAETDGQGEALSKRLDPAIAAKMLMSLLALALAGMALVSLAWLAARYFRRIARKPLSTSDPRSDDWYRKPLVGRQPAPPTARDDE